MIARWEAEQTKMQGMGPKVQRVGPKLSPITDVRNPDIMKTKARAAAVALLVVAGSLVAAPAQAHYDPWTTHWHYSNGQPTYKLCSWWDKMWGCQDENRFGIIVLR